MSRFLCGWLISFAFLFGPSFQAVGAEPKKPSKPAPAVAAPPQPIEQVLARPLPLDFIETPLSDVVAYLEDAMRIGVVLDHHALDDVGIDTATPITKHIKGVSARSALDLLLRDLELTWTITDEVLLITTPEHADAMLTVAVYDVRDLVAARDEKGQPCNDFEQLIDVITSVVAPSSWDTVGGPGSITGFQAEGSAAIVVSQTIRVHDKIAALLADLRKLERTKGAQPPVICPPRATPTPAPAPKPKESPKPPPAKTRQRPDEGIGQSE